MDDYLIAVFADRIQAESAYTALEQAGLPMPEMAILGKGYKSINDFDFIDPPARRQTLGMMTWLVPFGFLAGLSFDAITKLDTFPWAGTLGNQVLGGVLGAIAGMSGAIVAGGGLSLLTSDAPPYRKLLAAGQYLVVVTGNSTGLAAPILKQMGPQSLRGSN